MRGYFLTALSTRKHSELWSSREAYPLSASRITERFMAARRRPLKDRLAKRLKAPVKGCFNLHAAANVPGVARISLVH